VFLLQFWANNISMGMHHHLQHWSQWEKVFNVMEFYRDTLSGTYPCCSAGTHHSCLLHVGGMEMLKVSDTIEYLFVLQVSSLRIQ